MPTLVARLLAAALAALTFGAATGFVARALMRAINLTLRQPTDFSWAGTLVIALVFVLGMTPAALAAALARRPGGTARLIRWTGLLLSAGLLLTAAATTAVADGVTLLEVLPTGRLVLAIVELATFAAAIVTGAALTSRVAGRWADRLARGARTTKRDTAGVAAAG